MKVKKIHPFNISLGEFKTIQNQLRKHVVLENTFIDNSIKLCAGVDLAYWRDKGIEWGVCSVVIINYDTKVVVEKENSMGKIHFPYIAGSLALRELPLVIETVSKLSNTPDLFVFDGNGYLHPTHMGIATHASFFLNKPTIGIAKSYHKMHNINFAMPANKADSYENIVIGNEIYGRTLRTHEGVKPIFISCGNYIDLQTTMEFTLNLINNESRLPIPLRLADLETRHLRKRYRYPGAST